MKKNKMKINLTKVTFLCLLFIFLNISAQVGMPTTTPRGMLDLNREDGTHLYGLVLPTNADPNQYEKSYSR